MRGQFAGDAFMPLKIIDIRDFDGTLAQHIGSLTGPRLATRMLVFKACVDAPPKKLE